MAASQIRMNFHEESEAGINKQINWELYASYVYLSMSSYFSRDDVALPGLAKFFGKASDEEREHAQKLIAYQNKRGGRVVLNPIDKPSQDEWGNAIDSLVAALELEKTVNQASDECISSASLICERCWDSLLDLHGIATKHNDAQFCDFLESEYLGEQVEAQKELGDLITQLKRAGPGLGEWQFDQMLLHKD
ncbi:unnamed protein product [Notodromas monacha]|uniref:Ferritin n=1 Tax=Notodromas monacha TaxID=399045 RepID=A0A7R9GGX9_9CRUS|nr:unnamed protein product [Notodromas monacha]CAG0920895.1 unnamed protein product [Notodromas monacha]